MHILLVLAVGMGAGHLLRARRSALSVADKAMSWSLYLLIFLLGISVGTNEAVIHALGRLGVQALLLSLGGIAGSILVAHFVSVRFFEVARRVE